MGTPIGEFNETLRFLLGDHDGTVRAYPDEVLASAVRSVIRLNSVPGYTLSPSGTEIEPELSNPNHWALVAYHTVKAFVDSHPDRYSYRLRSISETFGSWRGFLDELKRKIHLLENGEMFSSWQSWYSWLSGVSGLPVGQLATRVSIRSPSSAVSIGGDEV